MNRNRDGSQSENAGPHNRVKQNKDTKLNIHYAEIQASYWIVGTIFCVFTVPMLQERGYTAVEIGTLTALRAVAAIVMQPVWAGIQSRCRERVPIKRWILLLCLISLGLTVMEWLQTFRFPAACILYLVYGATLFCIQPFVDAMATQFMAVRKRLNYSFCRCMGSVSWAVSCAVFGNAVLWFGADSILVFQGIGLILTLLAAISIETCRGKAENGTEKGANRPESESVWQIVKNYPRFRWFLAASACMFVGNYMSYNFLADVVRKLGGSTADMGYVQFIAAVCEIPVGFFFLKIQRKLTNRRVMAGVFFFVFLKLLLVDLAGSIQVLLTAQVLQMFGLAFFWSGNIYYIFEHLPEVNHVKGVALVTVCNMGIGACFGSLISGNLLQYFGIRAVTAAGAFCAFAGLMIMLLNGLGERKDSAQTSAAENNVFS